MLPDLLTTIRNVEDALGVAKRRSARTVMTRLGAHPLRLASVDKILSQKQVHRHDEIPHHAVSDDTDQPKPRHDVAKLVRVEPPHVAATRRVRRVEAVAATVRHRCQQGFGGVAERCKRLVQVERGQGAVGCFRKVRKTIYDI